MKWNKIGNIRGPKGNQGKTVTGPRGPQGPAGANGRNGAGVPTGGTTGQVLTKASNANYDTYWATGGGGGGAATQAPKLIETFTTDVSTQVGDLVKVSGSNSVQAITDNLSTTIPNGVFGVVTNKPTTTSAEVIFIGIQSGYSGFTTGQALYIDTDGTPTHTAPTTGTLQQIGFAVSTTSFFLYIQNPIRRG